MTRRPRVKEVPVPRSQLNFVVAAPLEMSPTNLSKEQIVRAHFDRRMTRRDFIPAQTSCNLKHAVAWKKCLEEPPREAPKNRYDRLRAHRGFALENASVLDEKPAGRPSCSSDPVRFDGLVNQLKRYAGELKVDHWTKCSVMFSVGPRMMDRISKNKFEIRDRRWKVLVYNDNSSAFIVVESQPNQHEQTVSITERALGLHYKRQDCEVISPANCDYAMLYKYGEEPRLINSASETPFAVVFDEEYAECRYPPSPEKFYSELLGYTVRFSRSMNDPEKKWLEERLKRYDLRSRKIRILEFYTAEDRNAAMAEENIEYLDVLFCDTAFSMKEPSEQLNLYVRYELAAKNIDCVAVTIANETDKAFAESAFISHLLSVHWFDSNGEVDNELKYNPDQKTIVLQHFPRHLDSFEAQDWLTKRIAKVNFIPIEKTEKFTQRIPGSYKSWLNGNRVEIGLRIEQGLYKIGHENGIYHPINEPWVENMQGGMGACWFLDLVKERPDVPWKVFRSNKGPYQKEEMYTVHFRTVGIGMQFLEHVLKTSYDEPIFEYDANDRQGPKLIPCYRLSIAISRSARRALKRKIASLDSLVRKTFETLSDNEDVIMETDEAWYYGARLFEEWQPRNDQGIIGVMGWNPTLVRVFTGRLRKLLEPVEFTSETQTDLFYGIGEIYAKSLPDRYGGHVVVDVDKYSQKIRLLGDAAPLAHKDLESYSDNKNSIEIQAEIPIYFPHYNNRLRELLNNQNIADLGRTLGVRLLGNDSKQALEFTGSISAYEKLTSALGEISAEIFIREVSKREGEDIPNMDCPTCMSPIGIGADYYRFDCGHVVCRRCTNSLIRTSMDNGQMVIMCLDSTCQRVISPKEIMHILFGDSERVRDFDAGKLQPLIYKTKDIIINSNPNLKPCTTADCPGILEKEAGGIEQPKGCNACKRPYCRHCLADTHEGRTCEDNARLQIPDESIKQWATEAGDKVKQCPNCSMMVEKRAGCNHMECIQCHTHFCWVCLFIATEAGAIYAHMTAEHGGHGGEYIDPENEDREMQHILHQQFGGEPLAALQQQERVFDAFFGDDDEELTPQEEDLLNREFLEGLGLHMNATIEEVRQRVREREENRRLNPDLFVLHEEHHHPALPNDIPPHLAGAPPGLNLPAEPVPQDPEAYLERPLDLSPQPEPEAEKPRPAQRLERIPDILPQLDPEYYSDAERREGLLEWINNSETQEEQDSKIAELVQSATNHQNS